MINYRDLLSQIEENILYILLVLQMNISDECVLSNTPLFMVSELLQQNQTKYSHYLVCFIFLVDHEECVYDM